MTTEKRKLKDVLSKPEVIGVLLAILILSMFLHIWTLSTLASTRAMARQQALDLSRQIEQIKNDDIAVNVNIDHAVPIRASIPVRQELTIPVSTTVDLNETIELSVETFTFDVPLDLEVPIDTSVPITIDETVDVDTTVDLDLTAPLTVSIQETSLAEYLENLQQALLELSEEL